MPYPTATEADVAFFQEHGWIASPTPSTRPTWSTSRRKCQQIIDNKESMAFDWAWEEGRPTRPSASSRSCSRARRCSGRRLRRGPVPASGRSSSPPRSMGQPLEFWYDQFLAKPPQQERGHPLAPGRGLLGPQPRRPGHHVLDAVPRRRPVQRLHALHRRRPPRRRARAPQPGRGRRATCSSCEPDESRAVACPLARRRRHVPPQQDAAHDHAPTSPTRGAASSRSTCGRSGAEGEGDHYPWKVYVNQVTGERTVPETR